METKEREIAINAHLEAIEDSAAIAEQDGTMNPETVLYHIRKIRELTTSGEMR